MKAILEIDMPDCCAGCELLNTCGIEHNIMPHCVVGADFDVTTLAEKRADNCPLKPRLGKAKVLCTVGEFIDFYRCPGCKNFIGNTRKPENKRCQECGQELDWG